MTNATVGPEHAPGTGPQDPRSQGQGKLEFHGGLFGAVLPLLVFLISVIWVTAAGMITMAAYFAPLVLVIALIMLLAKDRRAAADAMFEGLTDKAVAVMIFSFLGAGVLGRLLVGSGAVEAVVWLGYSAGVSGTLFVILSFVVTSLIATATGTSTGTVVTAVPVLYPAGVVLGAHPALLLGAIYSGARFGDNIAPISDTTIASVVTQGAELGDVVRSRLKYAFAAAGVSIVLYAVAGALMGGGDAGMPGSLEGMVGEYARPQALPMLLAPALTVYLCLRGRSLIHAIWSGILAAMGIGLVTGTLTFQDMFRISPPRDVGGLITEGVTGMRDVIFLIIFVMAILGTMRKAGVLDALTAWVQKWATTRKRAELAIFSLVSILYPITAVNTPAMVMSGPVVRELGEKFNIHPIRRANLMDLAGNGITGSLPHINTILALAGVMIAAHEALGVPLVSLPTVGLFTFHSTMLTVVGLFAIATGWGARHG